MARSSSTTLRIGALTVAWADVLQSDDSALSPENLGASDQRRFVQLDIRRRRQFLTGRALVTDMVAERFGAGSVDTGSCPACGGDHGPPVVRNADVRASVSYAGHLVVVAMGGVARLGIDVESELRDVPKDRERAEDMGRLLGVRASGAIRRWTQIEAVLKADGRGLREITPGYRSSGHPPGGGASAWPVPADERLGSHVTPVVHRDAMRAACGSLGSSGR